MMENIYHIRKFSYLNSTYKVEVSESPGLIYFYVWNRYGWWREFWSGGKMGKWKLLYSGHITELKYAVDFYYKSLNKEQ